MMKKELKSLINEDVELESMDIWDVDDIEELESTWNAT